MTEKDRLMLEELMNNTDKEELTRHAKIAHDLFMAYKGQGFTPTQSLELVKQLIDTTLKTNMLITVKQKPCLT